MPACGPHVTCRSPSGPPVRFQGMSERRTDRGPRRAEAGVRRPRARRPRPGAGPDRDVRPVVRRHGRGGTARAQRDGGDSTVSPTGRPSTRLVLLKGVDERGFVFYTNYDSRKGAGHRGQPGRARCCSPGTTCSARCGSRAPPRGSRRRRARRTSPPGRAGRSSAPGPRRSRRRWPRVPSWTRCTPHARSGSPARRRAAPAAVGRLPRAARVRGVLAGPQGPDARPAGLPPRRGRAGTILRLAPLSG